MKIEITAEGKLRLQFGYRRELVEAIKELPDRQYNPNEKTWLVGFDESNLQSILAMLAGNNWPADILNAAEAEAKEYLTKNPSATTLTENEFTQVVKPTLIMLGEIVLDAYVAGKINQKEQIEMLNLINHISLRDFITK